MKALEPINKTIGSRYDDSGIQPPILALPTSFGPHDPIESRSLWFHKYLANKSHLKIPESKAPAQDILYRNRGMPWVFMSFDVSGVAVANLLVVEDDEQVRVLVESFLEVGGHQTLSAATVEQALALLENKENHIDLMITDLGMRGDPEAGLKLAKKAIELRQELKVLYTSGQGVTDGMIALFVPKSAYLPKPYTGDQLAAVLDLKFGF